MVIIITTWGGNNGAQAVVCLCKLSKQTIAPASLRPLNSVNFDEDKMLNQQIIIYSDMKHVKTYFKENVCLPAIFTLQKRLKVQ